MSDPFEGHLPRTMAAIFRRVTMNQPMCDHHLAHTAVTSDVKIDSSATRQYGFNGASSSEVPAVEDKIYYCAWSSKCIVLERTIDRQQGNPTPTQQSNTSNLPPCIV
jgi:hypothetical protein